MKTRNKFYIWKKHLKTMLTEFISYNDQEKKTPISNTYQKITSIGLNFTLLMLSKPHVNEHMGLVLCSSQMSTCWPQVAKTASFQWWSIPVYTVFKGKKKERKKKTCKTKCINKCLSTFYYTTTTKINRSLNINLPCLYSFTLLKTKSPLLQETKSN